MEELNNIIRDKNKVLVISGILCSKEAFVGPEALHIDLTNRCNFDCIACWCRSPLLKDKTMPDWEKKLILSLDLIKGVFDDLERMGGLRQVKLVGGGEPFMHPDVLKIVEYIKNKDKSIHIDINTNFSLVDEEKVNKLLELGVDSLTMSIWAGSVQVYKAVHPNQTEETFNRIRNMLKFMSKRKRQLNINFPRIVIHNVIFNLNYNDIKEMLKFAMEIGADDIQFVPVDVVKGRTEVLLLDDEQRKILLEKLYAIRERYDFKSCRYIPENGNPLVLSDFSGFIRRTERLNIESGVYDEDIVEEVPCYVGWLFARIMATGNVVPCCKGHKMPLGNIYKNRFKDIWFSEAYNEFRYNGLHLSKSDPYFSRIGNDAVAKTGCYNCDNIWQNIPMHKKIISAKDKVLQLVPSVPNVLKNLFK